MRFAVARVCSIFFGRYHDHAVFVTDDPIPRINYLAAALHRAAYLTQIFRAARVRHHSSRKHGKRAAPDGGRIPDGAVNHHAGQTLAMRSNGGQFSPQRRIQFAPAVDYQGLSPRTL